MSSVVIPTTPQLLSNEQTSKRKASSEIEEKESKKQKTHIECNICVKHFNKKFKYICYNCGNMICLECKKKLSTYSGKTVGCPHCKSNNCTENTIPNHKQNMEKLIKISREHKNYGIIYEEIIKINNIFEYEVTQGNIDCNKFILELCELFIKFEYYELAFNWYEFLVEVKGNTTAMIKLGKMYEKGYHVKQDYKKSASLYTVVIDKGYIVGNYFLAYLYEEGYGVKKNLETATELYKIVAKEYIK